MANKASNASLKRRNEKIFQNIASKLNSDDEKAYVAAADKLRTFVSRREAYYPEARPHIVAICKTARATLTRLAKSDVPFHCNWAVPPQLKVRAAAYVRLIETVLQFVSTFENDHSLKHDLKDLFLSVTVSSYQPTDIQSKGQEESSGHVIQEVQSSERTRDGADLSQGGSRASSVFAPLSETSSEHKESSKESTPLHSTTLVSVTGMVEDNATAPKADAVGTSPSALHSVSYQPVGDSSSSGPSGHATRSSSIGLPHNAPAVSSVTETSADSPTTSFTPAAPVPKVTSTEPESSAKGAAAKPAAKAKRLKLKKAAPVDVSLIEADLNWHSSKQRQSSEPRASIGPVAAAEEASRSLPVEPVAPAAGVRDATSEISPGLATEVPFPAHSSDTFTIPAATDNDDKNTMDIDTAPLQTEHRRSETSSQVQPPVHGDVDMAEAPSEMNKGVSTAITADETGQRRESQPVHRDGSSQDPSHSPSISQGDGPGSYALKSIFEATPFTFVCIDFGRDVGDKLVLRYDLTSEQRQSLSLWQMRDQHERDVSSSVCTSLAAYRMSDALEAGFDRENKDTNSLGLLLSDLTPSWPTNARLSADIGNFRMFLAPPLQVTSENLVDVSPHVNETHIEILLDHAGDMRGYIFALVIHPPTPSQLQELEKRRSETRKFRSALDSLSITAVDLFG